MAHQWRGVLAEYREHLPFAENDTLLTLDQTLRRSPTHTIDLYAQWVFRPGLSMRVAVAEGAQPFGPPNSTLTTLLTGGDFTRVERKTGPQVNVTLDVRL